MVQRLDLESGLLRVRVPPGILGLIAQMVECLTEAQEVIGSIPIHSTHAPISQLVRETRL